MHARAVRVFIFDRKVIPDLTGFVVGIELLAGAHTPAFHGMGVHDPVRDVDVVDVLLADVVAAQPDVMIPVADLPLEISAAVVAAMPDRTAVHPINASGSHVPDGAIMDALDGF